MTQREPSSLKIVNVLEPVMKEIMLRYSQACVHLIQLGDVREGHTRPTAYLSKSSMNIWHLRLYELLYEHIDAPSS